MVGKNGPDFPMIGKFFRAFSNDWKTFSGEVFGRTMTTNPGHFGKETTRTTWDNFLKVRRPTGRRLGARASRPRGAGKAENKRKRPMFSVISHPAPRLKDRTASFHFSLVTCHCARRALRHLAAPLRMESGREEKDKQDKGGQSCGKGGGREETTRSYRIRGLEWLGGGRNLH